MSSGLVRINGKRSKAGVLSEGDVEVSFLQQETEAVLRCFV